MFSQLKQNKVKNAISQNDLILLEKMLAKGFDPNTYYSNKTRGNWLNFAAVKDCPRAIPLLVKYGAELDFRDVQCETPLIDASRRGHLLCAEYLLHAGANAEISNSKGYDAKDLARQKGESRIHSFICNYQNLTSHQKTELKEAFFKNVETNIKIKTTPKKVKQGNAKKLKKLILLQDCKGLARLFNSGVTPDTVIDKESRTTCLHEAVWHKRIDAVKTILDYDLDPFLKSTGGNTALVNAIRQQHYDITKLILETYPETINEAGLEGNSPLYVAFENKHYRIAEMLLERGADITQKNDLGNSISDLNSVKKDKKFQDLITRLRPDEIIQSNVKPKKSEPQETKNDPEWKKQTEHEISFTEQKDCFQISHYFNFAAGECLMVVENLKTGAQSHSNTRFNHIANQKLLTQAKEELLSQGGYIQGVKTAITSTLKLSKKVEI